MLTLRKVAITGGLSCGKTTVCQFFQQLGASVVSADEIVHTLLNRDISLQKSLIDLLGPECIEAGVANRKIIADKVFRNPDKLKQLEALLYPKVKKEIYEAYEQERKKGTASLFVAEVPLLYEAEMESFFDAVIVVAASKTTAQGRFAGSSESYEERSRLQMNLEEKIKKSSYCIYNNGSLEELKSSVQNLFNQLKHP